jgi:hypothetical protein
MSTVTGAQLREHVPGIPLPDAALQRIIDDIEEEILDRFGPLTEVSERVVAGPYQGLITTKRKVGSIVSIVEDLSPIAGESTRTLDPTDYRVSGYTVERLRGGTYPATGWAWYGTTINYVPVSDVHRRTMATIDAAKLELAVSGVMSVSIGDYSESTGAGSRDSGTPEERRTKLLRRRLAPRRGVVIR